MALITPVVTQVAVADISVVCPIDFGDTNTPINYNQIVASLTTFNYAAQFFYVASTSCDQVGQIYYYTDFDAFGNQVNHSLPFTIDPYQSQCAAYFYPEKEIVTFNGNSSLSFTMLPGQTLFLKIYTNTEFLGNLMRDHGQGLTGDSNFQELEHSVGLDYFEDYCFYIVDKPEANAN